MHIDTMHPDRLSTITTPVNWDEHGAPVSPRFSDRYRSEGLDGQGGLAQARHVFLAGCGLCSSSGAPSSPAAWSGADGWRVLENGFGLGLNFLATWDLWRRDPRRPVTLSYEATEAYPPTSNDLRRSAAPFADLAPLADHLANHWNRLLDDGALLLEEEAITLRLYVGDAQAYLPTLQPGIDTVFLDGFNPSTNPAMWSFELLATIGRLVRPGGHAATWCVARTVRDALSAAGFDVSKRTGLPPKRHCLMARRHLA